jgi:hypothetical protein
MASPHRCGEHRDSRPSLDVADIFQRFGRDLERAPLTPEQGRAVRAIRACRTAALGGHQLVCSACGYSQPVYNSCRNRHCPKCQALAQRRWVDACMHRVLPVRYFHVVFTLPQQLRALVHRNRRVMFELLFAAASKTLLTLGADPRRLGVQLGLTAVLHTWTRDLSFHPHLHTIVTGGGLTPAETWAAVKNGNFLFPVKVVSRLFRGKLLAGLKRAYRKGLIRTEGPLQHLADPDAFQYLIDSLYRKDFVVYAKRPFAGPQQVFAYLGHYTHRVGISNQRLIEIGDTHVRFKTKHGRTALLRGEEFVRRFLLHVLPKGFVKIRHYGLLASVNASTLHALRATLQTPRSDAGPAIAAPPHSPANSYPETQTCPHCGRASLSRISIPPSRPPPSLCARGHHD